MYILFLLLIYSKIREILSVNILGSNISPLQPKTIYSVICNAFNLWGPNTPIKATLVLIIIHWIITNIIPKETPKNINNIGTNIAPINK